MKTKLYILAIAILTNLSCKRDFLERPDENAPTLETYYTTAEQVDGATGLLYGAAWFPFMDLAFLSIGDIMGGTGITSGPGAYAPYMNFTVSETDANVLRAWQAFYKSAGVATILINTFEDKKSSVPDPAYLDKGIAESKFMRALAYFYLARIYKDVPIITDPVLLATSTDFTVPKYLQSDVLNFVIADLQAAEAGLPESNGGRVTSFAAKAMMAKVYLYMKDYENAKLKADEVITSGRYDLFPDYYRMFSTAASNGNIESIFEFKWIENGDWAAANHTQTNIGPGPLLDPVGAGGYSSVVPSINLLNSFESGDLRRNAIMEHGFYRADWTNKNYPNGYTYDTLETAPVGMRIYTATRTNSAKYVIGTGSNGEKVNGASNNMSTYILRYADVLLIYAEAVLADAGSTSDAIALQRFNMVRRRAGFPASADKTSLTKDLILHERMVEFYFEGDYWFDVQRQGFAKAKEILDRQERGEYVVNDGVRSIAHMDVKDTFISPNQLYLPIPAAEVTLNPLLAQPAVPYQ
ncbi:RagB/SusD family nutrient uptake outer membrane protein [Sphingobacterium chungjuense]|uniref:RagB/SusD family nutrient uptake outer membrane protein n=1 Tax=Sphingobacterium chungjuense TaxID=2675553 RepID=UPI00140829F4|nr:RagB/SusD family nutrient uptake outer membrane protein [Sphingobacterium chungjuense]